MICTKEQSGLIWIKCASTLGYKGALKLMELYGSAELAYERFDGRARGIVSDRQFAELDTLRKHGVEKLIRRLSEMEVRAVFQEDPEYPEMLRHIDDPPLLLFVKGTMTEAKDQRAVAVVGSRRETRYGRTQALLIARRLAENGVTVVSGLARGIDTAAHEGALEGKGRTAAVLGNGIASVYPEENKPLAERILQNGGAIISEFAPNAEPLAYNFPIRNRIISGMCQAVLLVEGCENSGTMITAGLAAEQGREVFALPGAVDAPGSFAPHKLLREGAHPCTCAEDILNDMGWDSAPLLQSVPTEEKSSGLSPGQTQLLRLLEAEPLHFEELLEKSGLSPGQLTTELSILEIEGFIEQRAGRSFARAK